MFARPTAEGRVPFRDGHTWYRITGDLHSGNPPIVVAHGGPGSTHHYLLALTELAEDGWPVVHYDQLGSGNSTRMPERGPDFWTVPLFLEELDVLLEHLGIAEDYVLFGQSWGGMLGAEHAIGRPSGLRGLVIADSPASMPIWRAEAARLRTELPADVQATLNSHEAAGTTDSPQYHAAAFSYYERFVCRTASMPPEVAITFRELETNTTVYGAMNGPTDFHVVGTIKDWSIVGRLHPITAPTLVISGRYDEATPATVQPYYDEIDDVEWEIFEESSHMPHVEEPERFFKVLRAWLATLG